MNRVVVMEMAGSSEEATKHRQETISVDLNSSVANFRTLVGDAFAKEPNNIQLIHLGTLSTLIHVLLLAKCVDVYIQILLSFRKYLEGFGQFGISRCER